ncbi:peptidoglycan-binding protein [Silicimonas algicola]|uniref:Putative peptidoglycan binding protein n=1 Tax=Silicimonas algicola TaxID=1826607 RepID=A0A316GBI2_9RHOB|nr:serine protease [Silicimonas algicola]AZQ67339.1 peptidoglycan-binding protein [Silicimonas algicola]PWK57020.1 putative peptidoglycan binding protein [Silicimonas algicola]
MNVWRVIAAICLSIFLAGTASAQQSWVQIEAQPTEREALSRANAYAAQLPDVNAFRLRSNWHAIALGPYSEAEARQRLLELRASRAVPSDAFVSDGRSFRDRIFGTGVAATAPAAPLTPPPVLEAGEETPAEARRSEAELTREDRALIQTAMQWEGVYSSVIDASFGPGTRRAMADWQQLNGYEPTGILTTLQRRELVDGYLGVLDALGLTPVIDERAGIQVDMPAGLVRFDRYESPFAHYAPATDDGVRVVLISQAGDANTLGALYDILQTLEIVPIEGERELTQSEFTIEGTNATTQSYTYARLTGGAVKGFTLAWPAGDEKRFRLALSRMRDSFTPLEGVLPDTEGTAIQNIDLLSGLEIRRPGTTASGFYIDGSGTVLTTSGAVAQCARVTLDGEVEAQVTARDDALGLALLTPRESLAPLSVARLSTNEPRLASDIAVAGYSYGGLLSAPVLSFGTLADVKGLDGDDRVQRLDVSNEPGDAGGPVFDGSGAVVGMLLAPRAGDRQLPGDVAFAADAPALSDFLAANGIAPDETAMGDLMAPEDLALLATDLTVLVSCWN